MNAVIDPVLSYCTATPGLAALLTGATAASEAAEITSELREALTARVAHLPKAALSAYLTTLTPPPP